MCSQTHCFINFIYILTSKRIILQTTRFQLLNFVVIMGSNLTHMNSDGSPDAKDHALWCACSQLTPWALT
jgi:hypothetical protein